MSNAYLAFNVVTFVAGAPLRTYEENLQILDNCKNIIAGIAHHIATADSYELGELVGTCLEGAVSNLGFGYSLKVAKPILTKHLHTLRDSGKLAQITQGMQHYKDELNKIAHDVNQAFKEDLKYLRSKKAVPVTPEGVQVPMASKSTENFVQKMGKANKNSSSKSTLQQSGQQIKEITKKAGPHGLYMDYMKMFLIIQTRII